jgi:hypothetical protein
MLESCGLTAVYKTKNDLDGWGEGRRGEGGDLWVLILNLGDPPVERLAL